MKKILLLFVILLSIVSCNKKNEIACREFEKKLKLVDSLSNTYCKANSTLYKTVTQLSKITGIETQAAFSSWVGGLSVSRLDYLNWLTWYLLNREKLYWDADVKCIKVSHNY